MLRDAQIIGCADMPQYADMPLLPLCVHVNVIHEGKSSAWPYPICEINKPIFSIIIIINIFK